jgi:hypothetical protein
LQDYAGMHDQQNIKYGKAKQAKQTHQYKNIKTKLYKTNAAVWYNLRNEINMLRKIVRQGGFIYKIIEGCAVNKT